MTTLAYLDWPFLQMIENTAQENDIKKGENRFCCYCCYFCVSRSSIIIVRQPSNGVNTWTSYKKKLAYLGL